MQISREKTHLDPGDKLGHVAAHQLGEGGRREVVLAGPSQPVHHDHVGAGLALVQGGHQLGHPALEHARHLRLHTHTHRVLVEGLISSRGQLRADLHCSGASSQPGSWTAARALLGLNLAA